MYHIEVREPDGEWAPLIARKYEDGFPTYDAAARIAQIWRERLDLYRSVCSDSEQFELRVVGESQ